MEVKQLEIKQLPHVILSTSKLLSDTTFHMSYKLLSKQNVVKILELSY